VFVDELKDREVKQHLLMGCEKSLKLETKKVAAVGAGNLAEVRVPAPTKTRSPGSKHSRNGQTAWWQCGTSVFSEESTTDTRIYDRRGLLKQIGVGVKMRPLESILKPLFPTQSTAQQE
jgi:hypothetical protein